MNLEATIVIIVLGFGVGSLGALNLSLRAQRDRYRRRYIGIIARLHQESLRRADEKLADLAGSQGRAP